MYKIGICDDDKVFCAGLEETVYSAAKELNQKIETEVWYSGESIMRDLEKLPCPDILFLDIELYEKSGIDVGKYIRNGDDYTTHIVYVSSKQEYAMQLFRLQPLDFLIKPVSKEQVKEVLERSMKQRMQSRALFEYQKGSVYYQVPCRDILYFMSNDKKVNIITKDGIVGFYGKLKDVADRLPAGFLMIHQSYIINSDYVAEYTYENVKMQDGTLLNISKPYRKIVRGRITELEKERLHVGR
ncbi:MAG: response regulator transcription factor [Lachnospiraceae bacterium]|nr:response regulator transcription factor [Lachnospiraceae bacterium]